MTSGHVLELMSLPTSHPQCGPLLLHQCGLALIVRLSIDPMRLSPGIMNREVSVNWVANPGDAETTCYRSISWSGMPTSWDDLLVQWDIGISPQEHTEKAAIAVMGLLIHDLMRGEILKVLPIGSGGDYLAKILNSAGNVQVECSGILSDETGWDSRSVLNKKKAQVLTNCDDGFASVTTFSHTQHEAAHSYLHRVRCGVVEAKTTKARRR